MVQIWSSPAAIQGIKIHDKACLCKLQEMQMVERRPEIELQDSFDVLFVKEEDIATSIKQEDTTTNPIQI